MDGRRLLQDELGERGAIEVLREAEDRRVSGWIRFELEDGSRGEIRLLAGEPTEEQTPLDDGRDPLDAFLEAHGGCFELWQCLPSLPVSRGDGLRREGSLAVHVPADLMHYCEQVGLTGRLLLRRADRNAEALYDRGELLGIRLDGRDSEDLHAVFGWEEGTFLIEACLEPPSLDAEQSDPNATLPARDPDPEAERGDTTGRFLRVVEMELSRIVEERERRRPASRSSPEATFPRAGRRHETLPPPPERSTPREPTVRIVYLAAPEDPSIEPDERTRHVAAGTGEREEALPKALPDRQGQPAPRDASIVGSLGWVALVLFLLLAAVGLLSRLPPL